MDETVPVFVAVVTALSLVAGGGVAVLVTYRAAAGRLPPNHLAGMRTAATLASPAAWRAAHRAALRPTVIGGAGAVVAGLAVLALREPVTFFVVTLGGAAWVVAGVVRGLVVGDRAARQRAGADEPS